MLSDGCEVVMGGWVEEGWVEEGWVEEGWGGGGLFSQWEVERCNRNPAKKRAPPNKEASRK